MPTDRSAPEHAVDTLEDERPSFRAARKGYDPDEVDAYIRDLLRERDALAEDLHATTGRNDRLRSELATAHAELQAHLDHAAAIAASPGTEGDRLVEAARTAALEIRTRAQIEANDLIKAANDEVRAVRADAEQLVIRRTREAEQLAGERLRDANEGVQHAHEQAEALIRQTQERAEASLEAARTRARTLVADAEEARAVAVAEAAVTVHEAERRGRELIDEARAVRERIIGELTRRRAKLRTQVEQLQAGRDRLLDAFQIVRDALDEATVELEVVLPEARDAALDAAQRAATEPDPVLDQALARLRADAPHDRDELAVVTGEHQTVEADALDGGPVEVPDERGPEPGIDGGIDTDAYDTGVPDDVGLVARSSIDEPTQELDVVAELADAEAEAADGAAPGSVLLGHDDGYGEAPPRRMALAPDPAQGRWSSAVRIIARPSEPDPAPDDADDDGDAADVFGDGSTEGTADGSDDGRATPDDLSAGAVTTDEGGGRADGDGADGAVASGSTRATPAAPAGSGDVPGDHPPAGPGAEDDRASETSPVGSERAPSSAPAAAATPAPAAVGRSHPDDDPVPPPGSKLGALVGSSEPRLPAALVGSSGRASETPPAEPSGDGEALDPVAALEARRDRALTGPTRQLRRRLKATLVEEENELLHAIRGDDALPKAHEVLAAEQVHRDRFASAAQPGLLAATVAGQELGVQIATEDARRRVPGALPQQLLVRPEVDTETVDQLAADLAAELATELRARLAACFPVGPPTTDDPRRIRAARDELSSAVRSAYRGTKAGFVDRVCDRVVAEALNRAVRAQIPEGTRPAGVDVRALFPVSAAPRSRPA